jgi:zinc transporter
MNTAIAETNVPGLVWAYRFSSPDAAPQPLMTSNEITAAIAGDGFVWLHFAQTDVRLELTLQALGVFDTDEIVRLVSRDRHMTLSVQDATLWGVLPDCLADLGTDAFELGRFHFVANHKLLVTVRAVPLTSMSAARTSVEHNMRLEDPIGLLGTILRSFEKRMSDWVQSLEDGIDEIEDAVFNDKTIEVRHRLSDIRRKLVQVHRVLRTQVRLFQRLDSTELAQLPGEAETLFEALGHHFAALDQDTYALNERARLLFEEIEMRQQNQINNNLFILSVATAVLLPPTLVTGYFGMNTKDLPLQNLDGGSVFATLLAVGAGLGSLLILRQLGILRR